MTIEPKKQLKNKVAGTPMLLELVDEYKRCFASGDGHTAKAKKYDLRLFVDFLSIRLQKPPPMILTRAWTPEATEDFVKFLMDREAPATVSRRLATLKHMGRELAERYPSFVNPARTVKGPKASPPTPKRLPDSKLQEMRQRAEARASDGSFVHVRNLMIFEFLLATGIRVDELRTMKLAQLTQDHQWCRNVKCKGQTYRNVYLKSGVRSLLKKYLAEREQELRRVISKLDRITDSGLPLFPSVYGASATDPESFRMGSKTLWRAISDLAPGVSPHALRHTFAHWLLEATGDLRLVAQALGHSDVRVTMRYTEREDDSIAEAIEGAGS